MRRVECAHPFISSTSTLLDTRRRTHVPESDGRTDVFAWDGVDVGTKNQCDDGEDDDDDDEDGGVSQEECRRFHY